MQDRKESYKQQVTYQGHYKIGQRTSGVCDRDDALKQHPPMMVAKVMALDIHSSMLLIMQCVQQCGDVQNGSKLAIND